MRESTAQRVGVSFAHTTHKCDPKWRCVRMKVLIGVDPHKLSVAVAAVNEVVGELVECTAFPQNRAGLRTLENALSETVSRASLGGRERRGPWGRHLAQRLAAAGEESVVEVPPKLSARVLRCSPPATLAKTTDWTPSPPRS